MSSLEAALEYPPQEEECELIKFQSGDEWEEYLAALEDIPEEYIKEKELEVDRCP